MDQQTVSGVVVYALLAVAVYSALHSIQAGQAVDWQGILALLAGIGVVHSPAAVAKALKGP